MKKITLSILLFIGFTTFSFSQIKKIETSNSKTELVGKYGGFGVVLIKCEKQNNTYTFTYSDTKFKHIDNDKSFSFKDLDNDFQHLYQTIMEGFEEVPEKDIMLELPNDVIWLSFEKAMGNVSFRFTHSKNKNKDVIGYSVYLTKKRVQKLFGMYKKKKRR